MKSIGKKIGPVLYFLTCVALSPPLLAQVRYVTVEAEGYGSEKSHAVADALLQAVSQVNGAEVAGQTLSSMNELSVESSEGNAYLLAESFQSAVATRSNGVIKAWSVISESQDPERYGLWTIRIVAEVSKYQSSKQLKRLRMAVMDFRIDPAVAQKTGEQVARAFTSTLEDGLTQTRRFAMLDRSFMEEQTAELQKVASAGFATEELARLGNRAGTDYLIVGIVTEAGVTSQQVKLKTSNRTIQVNTISMAISYRIIDATTTQLKFSAEVSDAQQGVDSAAMAKALAKQSVLKILNAIFPVSVLQLDGQLATLGQGGDMLTVGQKLKLVKLGPPLVDPYTKESLGRQEVTVGEVEITDVQAKTSTAVVTRLDSEVEASTLIVRPYETKPASLSPVSVEENTQEAKEKIKSLKEKSSDDW